MRHRLEPMWRIAVAAACCVPQVIAQDPTRALTKNYQTLLDNDEVLVVHVHYDGHEELAVHDHSHYPTVYVYLSNSGPVRFSHDEARPFALTRLPVKAGWFRVSPGRMERHTVANLSAVSSDFLRVECKHIPLGQPGFEFRFAQDVDLTRSSATKEFSSPDISIHRYVAAPGSTEGVNPVAQPQLLIAVSPSVLRRRGQTDMTMARGSVIWVMPESQFQLIPSGPAPAHILAIELSR